MGTQRHLKIHAYLSLLQRRHIDQRCSVKISKGLLKESKCFFILLGTLGVENGTVWLDMHSKLTFVSEMASTDVGDVGMTRGDIFPELLLLF